MAAAWIGGGLFTAHVVLNPFVAAKQPYLNVEAGLLRALPVELTMVNDLPINLDAPRARVEYGDPALLLYYLDHNAYRPEPPGIWIAAERRADLVVRAGPPIAEATVTLLSRVANTVEVSLGGATEHVELAPGVPRDVVLLAAGRLLAAQLGVSALRQDGDGVRSAAGRAGFPRQPLSRGGGADDSPLRRERPVAARLVSVRVAGGGRMV